ncbi:MAG: enoyl-CoA hydratase/isomerase family protein [Lautropia sp.]
MIATSRHGATLLLELARPDRGNALSAPLVESMIAAVEGAFADPALDTLVLCGRGRNFCTGLDLSDLEQSSDGDMLLRLVRIETLLSLLWHAPIRTACLAHGRSWGAGADLVVACERRGALPGASFRFPGVQFGILLGTRRLAERVGSDTARGILVEARHLDLAQAVATGLVGVDGLPSTDPGDAAADAPAVARAWLGAFAAPAVSSSLARGLRRATRADRSDEDLANLVRSASLPGLKQRIAAYRAAATAGR